MNFNKEEKINALTQLGTFLLNPSNHSQLPIQQAQYQNAWFTPDEVKNALIAIGKMLNYEDLHNWLAKYTIHSVTKNVGLVLAGNIPLVGFHDILCILATNHIAHIKLSSQDNSLILSLINFLIQLEPKFGPQIKWVNKLENFDAVIATGSNNSSRYFEAYFSKVPHIIRKNRHSIAVLNGDESEAQLQHLGSDIFSYFGLGCRNVSKLFVPNNYKFDRFFESIEIYNAIINHHKYNNNYDYNKSILLVNKIKHFDNGFLLVTQSDSNYSPLAVLYYQEYNDLNEVEKYLQQHNDSIQIVVSNLPLNSNIPQVAFGSSQNPKLWDYADGVDTMNFLTSLH